MDNNLLLKGACHLSEPLRATEGIEYNEECVCPFHAARRLRTGDL